MTSHYSELNWYVVKTKSRAERKVVERLMNQSLEVYLPECTLVKQWSDRKKAVKHSLIPSTLFVKCSKNDLLRVLSDFGVTSILKYLGEYAIVKNQEIELLKQYCNQGYQDSDESYVKGDFVDVVSGELQGLSGQMLSSKGKHKIRIKINEVGIACTVEIPKSFVTKIKARA